MSIVNELNCVEVRSRCSIEAAFERLAAVVESDVDAARKHRLPSSSTVGLMAKSATFRGLPLAWMVNPLDVWQVSRRALEGLFFGNESV